MWVARDKDVDLFFYVTKPIQESSVWNVLDCGVDFVKIDHNLFPEVKWEDDEPTEVDIVIKAKKPTLHELYENNSLGETIIIDDND